MGVAHSQEELKEPIGSSLEGLVCSCDCDERIKTGHLISRARPHVVGSLERHQPSGAFGIADMRRKTNVLPPPRRGVANQPASGVCAGAATEHGNCRSAVSEVTVPDDKDSQADHGASSATRHTGAQISSHWPAQQPRASVPVPLHSLARHSIRASMTDRTDCDSDLNSSASTLPEKNAPANAIVPASVPASTKHLSHADHADLLDGVQQVLAELNIAHEIISHQSKLMQGPEQSEVLASDIRGDALVGTGSPQPDTDTECDNHVPDLQWHVVCVDDAAEWRERYQDHLHAAASGDTSLSGIQGAARGRIQGSVAERVRLQQELEESQERKSFAQYWSAAWSFLDSVLLEQGEGCSDSARTGTVVSARVRRRSPSREKGGNRGKDRGRARARGREEARRDSVNDAALHYSRTYASEDGSVECTLSTKVVACPRNTDGKPGSGHEAGEINKNADVGNDGQQHLWEEWEQEQRAQIASLTPSDLLVSKQLQFALC